MAVETGCRFHARSPSPTRPGRPARRQLGTSSVRYEVGIFRNDEATACADGHFVHVFVDRADQRPVPIPNQSATALESLSAR